MAWYVRYQKTKHSVFWLVEMSVFALLFVAGAFALIFTQREVANKLFGLVILPFAVGFVVYLVREFRAKGIRFERCQIVRCPSGQNQFSVSIAEPNPQGAECPQCGHRVAMH